jgi:hypothetical protein
METVRMALTIMCWWKMLENNQHTASRIQILEMTVSICVIMCAIEWMKKSSLCKIKWFFIQFPEVFILKIKQLKLVVT